MRPPRPATWAFNEKNDLVFATRKSDQTAPAKRVKPDEWIRRGTVDVRSELDYQLRRNGTIS